MTNSEDLSERQLFLEKSQQAATTALGVELKKIQEEFGVDNAIFGAFNFPDGTSYASTTYSEEVIRYYQENNLLEADPILFLCQRTTDPVDWSTAEKFDPAGVIRWARENGLGNHGVSIPIHEPSQVLAILSVTRVCSDEEWHLFLKAHLEELTERAAQLLRIAFASWNRVPRPQQAKLAKRQVEILQLFAAGLTAKDIGEKLGLSQRTVENHMLRIRERLDANNTHQAVAKAIGMKIIFPA